ncbi:Alpha-tubulin N-acetyltransferase 1 [Tyrophagus putrescentiae]|nr:Alpha-tubulin N-acetyltransferase 1 [Tyrophagus putrescentiae]
MAAENAAALENSKSPPSSKVVLTVDRHLRVTSSYVVSGSTPAKGEIGVNLSAEQIASHIDLLGAESAKAQQLQVPITSALKLTTSTTTAFNNEDNILYLLYEVAEEVSDHRKKQCKYSPLGLLRFGHRKLYCSDGTELRLLAHCPAILDFYVREQRRGHGRLLFDCLLLAGDGRDGGSDGGDNRGASAERPGRLTPGQLAYDRPSPAMVAFLRRHYSLASPRPQHNHYVIFDDIWRRW